MSKLKSIGPSEDSAVGTVQRFLKNRLFDLVPSAVAVIDRDYRVVEANRNFEELFGEWHERHCFEVYKSIKRRCGRCAASLTFRDGKTRVRHEEGVDRLGRKAVYVVHVAAIVDADGSIPYLVEMSTNITSQHQLRAELTRAHTLNRALIESSGDAVVALGTHGRVTLWNPAATELFGWTSKEVMGRRPPPGLFPDGFSGILRDQGTECRLAEVRLPRKDGGTVPVGVCGVPLRSGREMIGSAAFFHDLREIKQLESDKLDAERLAAVGQTVAGLAHGVKNILTGLEGGLYLMRTGLEKGKEQRVRDGFSMLSRNIGRVTAFVRALLDFSRGQTPVVQVVDPLALAGEVVALFRDAAAQEGIEVALVGEPIEPACFDPEGIHSCLSNLVTNAIDACRMSEAQQPRVEISVAEEPDSSHARPVKGAPAPTAVVFTVSDNGEGMDYEIKQKVFTNFFTTKGEGGTGLGLLLTRKITQEHGGKVTVDSEPGHGTVFRLVFPRRRLPSAPSGPPCSPSVNHSGKGGSNGEGAS